MAIHLYKKKWTNAPALSRLSRDGGAKRATVIYWLLLIYVLAALIWWFIALNRQNRQMAEYRMSLITRDDSKYAQKADKIFNDRDRMTTAYISEGLVFLIVISIGAIFLYSAVMRQIRIQRQQQNFMMAITHELKTPISIARLNIETLQKHALDETKREKIIKSSLQEINRLNTLTGNILVSAQLEGGSYLSSKEDIDFSQIVKESSGDFVNRFPNRDWKIEIMPDLFISGDPLLMQILVNNLIENAVKYSAPYSTISIQIKKDHSQGIMEVSDQGPGIPKNEHKRIFQKFYRVGNEDTRTTQGTGLGLYLCRKITQDHKMSLRVSDNSPRGTIFTVRFNLSKL